MTLGSDEGAAVEAGCAPAELARHNPKARAQEVPARGGLVKLIDPPDACDRIIGDRL